MPPGAPHTHSPQHAFTFLNPRVREGLTVHSRRSMLKASLAGLAGLTLPGLLRMRAEAATGEGKPLPADKSVILLWMTGGPSHIDTWDPKPEMPREIRGPFKDIPTEAAGRAHLRVSAEAGGDARSGSRSSARSIAARAITSRTW